MSYRELQAKMAYKLCRADGAEFSLEVDTAIPLSGGIVGIYGPSGHGKSTMLKICSGNILSAGASVTWVGHNQETQVTKGAEQCPAVYQQQSVALFEHLTVRQNIELVASHSNWTQSRQAVLGFAQVVEWCAIHSLLEQKASTLSGGEKQRVGLARSLICGKPVVILDEPFSALDWTNRRRMLSLIKHIQRHFDMRFIFVSHSLRELALCCDYLVHINDGKIVNQGSCTEIIHQLSLTSMEPVFSRLQTQFEQALSQYHLTKWRLIGSQNCIYTKADNESKLASSRGEPNIITIDADKVSITRTQTETSSILNRLRGRIVAIAPFQHLMLVTIDIGSQQLYSLISGLSLVNLKLQIGQEVLAQFKAI